jgi:hypothetical protein
MSAQDDFNSLLRQAAGHARPFEHRDPPTQVRVGDIGVGRGGSAGLPPQRTDNDAVNAAIRQGATIVRQASVRNGVNLTDVPADIWGR